MGTDNLTIGAGELWFSPFRTGTQEPAGFYLLGNCPSVSLTRESDMLQHRNAMRAGRRIDKTAHLESRVMSSFTCEDIRKETLALYLQGTASALTVSSATGSTSTLTGVIPGRTYQVGVTAAAPYGARQIASVVVANGATTYVAGTDYEVDLVLGLVTILAGGAITAGTNLTVTYNQTAHTRDLVVTGEEVIEGAAMFVAYNEVGKRVDYLLPWVTMTPNGEYQLITEEWASLSMMMTGQRSGDKALCYANGRPVLS